MSSTSRQTEKLRVFISYSRADMKFADELADGLEYDGDFDVSIDRESIAEGEDWKARLSALIAEADTVIFVLSPKSAASPICSWEVDEAHRLSKRILPALFKPVDSTAVHPTLAALNYVRFDTSRTFMGSLRSLAQALKSDLGWLREHTRYLSRAMSWDSAGRPENRLLFGKEVDEAKQWMIARPRDAPEPTALHLDFIRASESAEAERQNAERKRLTELARRTRFGLILLGAVLTLTIVVGAFTYFQNQQLQSASLRLSEGIKLKIAKTDRLVYSTEKWYRVATEAKLTIAIINNSGTGFLIDGGSLHPKWSGEILLLTAAHVIRFPFNDGVSPVKAGEFTAVFPAIDTKVKKRLGSLLFMSQKLDFAILALGDSLSRHVQHLVFKPKATEKRRLEGVAVLHWTGQGGFSLGLGHGIDRPADTQMFGAHPLYYTHMTGYGASGAPVFSTDTGELVCLHQAGMPGESPPWSSCTAMSDIVKEIADAGARDQTVSSAPPAAQDPDSTAPPK